MKYSFLTIAASLISSIALSQNFADFNAQKKTISLKTGIHMKYVDTGDWEGTPVLLLHGYTDTSRSFQVLMEELGKLNQNLRIIAPDLRGHGGTSMPDADKCKNAPEKCFTQEQFAEDIIDLMDQLKLSKVHLVGHSMGSVTAQTLSLKYPDRISTIVLIGTFVNGKESAAIHGFLIEDLIEKNWKSILDKRAGFNWPSDAYTLTPDNLGGEVRTFLRDNWVTEVATEASFLDAILQETVHTQLGTWIGAIKALGEIDNHIALQKLKVPTLILWPASDSYFTIQDQQLVKNAFRGAAKSYGTMVIYKTYGELSLENGEPRPDEAGHNLHWAVPKEVAADIHSFITIGAPINSKERSIVKLE